jgi:hypothetical protein
VNGEPEYRKIKRPLPLIARAYPVAHPVPPGTTPRCASGQRLDRRTAAWPCGDWAGWRGASDGGIIIRTTTANSHGGGTITAAGIYVGSTLLNVPDHVFDDPGYKHLSMSYVMAFVKEHAHLHWTTGRAELGKIDLGQRLNEVLESVENLYLYSQQLFKYDKQRDQEIQDLKDHIRSQQKEIEMLKQAAANSS